MCKSYGIDRFTRLVVGTQHVFTELLTAAGRVYRQKHAYVNTASCVVSSTKMAIHTAGRVYSHFVNVFILLSGWIWLHGVLD